MNKKKFKAFLEKEIARLSKALECPENQKDQRVIHWIRAQRFYAIDLLNEIEEF